MLGFLKKPRKQAGWLAVGIDTDAIRIAQLAPAGVGKPRVGRWGAVARNSPEKEASLAQAAKESNLPPCECTTLLLPSDYQILAVEAPNVPRDELKAAIRWRIKDLIEYHVDDATVDVLEIPGDVNAEGKARSMYAVAAQNEVIRKRIAAFDDTRLELKVIDIPEMAQRNVALHYEQPDRCTAMVAFRTWGGLLTFTYQGELLLTRRLEVSSDQLALPEHRHHYFERVATELRRSFENLERKFHQSPVGELLLAPMPEETGLAEYLAANLYVPVREIRLSEFIEFPDGEEMNVAQQWEFFHLFGAAMRVEHKAL